MIFSKNTKNIKDLFLPDNLAKIVSHFLGRYARLFVFLIAFALVVFCINLWYDTIYHSDWSADKVQSYIQSKGQGITFNENGFEYDIAAIKARSEESQKDLGNLTDIFRLKSDPAAVASPTAAISTSPKVAIPTPVAVPNVSVKSNSSSGILPAPVVSGK